MDNGISKFLEFLCENRRFYIHHLMDNLLRRETGRLVLVVLLVIGADQMRNIEFFYKNLDSVLLLSALLGQQNIIQLQIASSLQ
jgi:hypothetical protein